MRRIDYNKVPATGNRWGQPLFLLTLCFLFLPLMAHAVEVAPRISDREIVERLTRMEERLDAMEKRFDERFDAMEKRFNERFDAMERRFDAIDKRFVSIDAQFDRLVNIMIAIVMAFAAVVASTIGFAVWDRRTMIRPFETKVKAIEEAFSENRQQVHALIESMKTLSQRDEQVAAVLKKFHLL